MSTGIRSAAARRSGSRRLAEQDAVIGLVYLDTACTPSSFGRTTCASSPLLANVAAAKIENVRLLEESLEKRRLKRT
jgi:hypothetical protein